MKISPDRQTTVELYDKLRVGLAAEVREGVHVSDLLQPRKAYWQKLNPLPPTNDEIGYWLAGRAHHYFLVQALTGVDDSQEASLIDPETGVHYSPDLVQLRGEFKTTRWSTLPETEAAALRTFDGYIPQCRAYAALMRVSEWRLYVFFLVADDKDTGRKIPTFRVYKLEFTEAELEQERQDVKLRQSALLDAIAARTPEVLPLCPQYACYIERRIRNGEPSYVRGANNGRLPAKARTPICKYWHLCKPEGRYVEQ